MQAFLKRNQQSFSNGQRSRSRAGTLMRTLLANFRSFEWGSRGLNIRNTAL